MIALECPNCLHKAEPMSVVSTIYSWKDGKPLWVMLGLKCGACETLVIMELPIALYREGNKKKEKKDEPEG
jgi:hypothetical protein|tara:strand:+ start:2640 stop:2852 length:213 start_codon:yes stop_codon:yes gene_type:complete